VYREVFIEAHELPSDRLVMDAAATDLPDTHNPMVPSTVPDSVNLATREYPSYCSLRRR
jgi:hypothetical protein